MPASLRDRLIRLARTIVRARTVSPEYRLGKPHLAHPQIGDRGAECRVADADADHEAQSKRAVYQTLPEFGPFGEFGIEMQRLRVHRQGAEQHVVHLGDGAARGHGVAGLVGIEVATTAADDAVAFGEAVEQIEGDCGWSALAKRPCRDTERNDRSFAANR